MRRANIFEPEFDHSSERDGYRWRGSKVGESIGSAGIGGRLYHLGDGERIFPYHFHHGMEEWLLVVEGTPTVRTPAGERMLRAGDVVCFPAGAEGGHQVRGPGTVLIFSANRFPETLEYPESGKVATSPPGKVFRLSDAVGYWEGE